MLVFIGDLHLKDDEPFLSSAIKLFQYLDERFPEDELFFVGDITDSSAPHWEVFSLLSEFLKNRKQTSTILGGNHDYSKVKGSVLKGLQHINNVRIILEPLMLNYGRCTIFCLPFSYGNMKERYEALTGNYDYIITHTTPSQLAFGNEGIDYKLKGTYIHGHIHVASKYRFTDDLGNAHFILGVPFPTRFGEQDYQYNLFKMDEQGNIQLDGLPYFHSYETVKFGEQPTNRNNILNVIDAPDANSVYEEYKGFYIRDDGIELKRSGMDTEDKSFVFDAVTVKDKFKTFCFEHGISQEVLDCGLKYLEGL